MGYVCVSAGAFELRFSPRRVRPPCAVCPFRCHASYLTEVVPGYFRPWRICNRRPPLANGKGREHSRGPASQADKEQRAFIIVPGCQMDAGVTFRGIGGRLGPEARSTRGCREGRWQFGYFGARQYIRRFFALGTLLWKSAVSRAVADRPFDGGPKGHCCFDSKRKDVIRDLSGEEVLAH